MRLWATSSTLDRRAFFSYTVKGMSLSIVQHLKQNKPWNNTIMQAGSHCIVLTSDVKPCPNFLHLAQRLAEIVPNEPVCLMLPGEVFRKAHKEGFTWCASIDGVSGALMLPRQMAQKWQSWATWCAGPIDDESSMVAYFWSYGKRILHPMPPLVTPKVKPGWLAGPDATWSVGDPYLVDTLLRNQDPAEILRGVLTDGVRSHFDFKNRHWTCEAAQAFAP